MASKCNNCSKTRAQPQSRIASAEFDHIPIQIQHWSAFDIPENCRRALSTLVGNRHAVAQALGTTYYDRKWSGNYPLGIFQWKWADVPQRWNKKCDKNGRTGLANIILSSTSEFPPGLHKVHYCAHKPCKEIASSAASLLGVRGAPLHLFAIDSGIAMRNVPQSRNASEAAAISALFPAVAEPSPPSPPAPKRKVFVCNDGKTVTAEEYVRSGGRLTAKKDEHPVDLAYAHVDEGSDGEPIPDKKEWQEGDHFHGFEFVDYPEAPEGLAWYPGPEHGSYVLKAAESHWTAAELEEELFIADAELEVESPTTEHYCHICQLELSGGEAYAEHLLAKSHVNCEKDIQRGEQLLEAMNLSSFMSPPFGKRKASDTIGDVKDKIKAKRNR